jgi:uncharacterized membrane protein HdeD (DUF308 family)
VLAIAMPFVTGVGVVLSIGLILIATGVAQFLFTFKSRSFGEGALRFVFSLLAIITGIALISQPGAGLATITVFLAVWFLVDGIWSIIAGFRWRPLGGWVWMVIGGVVSIVLSVMIYRQFPESAVWLVGVLVGVRLLFTGFTMIMLGSVSEAAVRNVEKATDN